MQPTVTLKRSPGIQWHVITLLVLVLMISTSGTVSGEQVGTGDTILIRKQQVSKKHGIRLYPDAAHQVLFFEAKGIFGKAYQLFIFDVEGKLVKQVNIKNKQTTVLENIDKGDYLFEVFSDDERIENGEVRVR